MQDESLPKAEREPSVITVNTVAAVQAMNEFMLMDRRADEGLGLNRAQVAVASGAPGDRRGIRADAAIRELQVLRVMMGRAGIEPATLGLKVEAGGFACSRVNSLCGTVEPNQLP